MALLRSNAARNLSRLVQIQRYSYPLSSSGSYSNAIISEPEINCRSLVSYLCQSNNSPCIHGSTKILRSTMVSGLAIFGSDTRSVTTHAKAPPQVRQMGAMQVSMLSPGFVYEPYAPRQRIPFWQRWFTRSGWRRTKEDIILEINTLLAHGDKTSLRKLVTENLFSVSFWSSITFFPWRFPSCFTVDKFEYMKALKNDIKQRESMWSTVYWELVEPAVKIRTLRARLIGVDRSDINKVFIQLTLEFLTKQKFEAYDSNGAVVAGDKNKEVLVRDIWVFEKSLFHPGAYWRLCGRISL
ncbi:hypothetical protein Cgig2_003450 [Carnegiea gigantea]|uniref:Large ribosomal subunit protein mL45 n=2 Tax=Cactaceae TaxID=3593 RepID=A0A9Q1KBX4_9CARY|nr:hypothetical protein Cgig2_003450 [Carnegiea gigantea]